MGWEDEIKSPALDTLNLSCWLNIQVKVSSKYMNIKVYLRKEVQVGDEESGIVSCTLYLKQWRWIFFFLGRQYSWITEER